MDAISLKAPNSQDDRFEVVTDLTAFTALESDWDDLCGRSSHVRFAQSFAWRLMIWEEVEAPQARWLHCIVARNRDRAVLIWPFIVYRKDHLVVASPLGGAHFEYPDPLVEDGPEVDKRIEAAWKRLCDTCGCDLVKFRHVRKGSPLHRFLRGKAGKHAKRVARRKDLSTYLVGVSPLYRLGRRYPALRPVLRRYRQTSRDLKHALTYRREVARAKRKRQSRHGNVQASDAGFRAFGDISATQWNALARMPTQRHCWARAALDTVNARDEPWPIVSGDALAPFVFKRGDPHSLAFIGDAVSEPFDVMSEGDALDGLAEAIAETGMPVHLKRVPEGAAIITALDRVYRERGFVTVRPWRFGCPYIELDDSWREPERHFSAQRRWTLGKRRRRAESLGHVTFDIVTPDSTNIDALVTEAFTVEASGWKRRSGSAIAVSPWRRAFYGRFARYASEEGILRLCFLRIGGKAAAMEFAIEFDGRFFGHKIGYDERFAECSPGNLLRLEILRDAAERGLQSYEFQGFDAPWTYGWTKSVRPMVSVTAHPATARRFWAFP
jgi:CelD/BcsL family acetyltransferase involved in cellulose biosynthesis